MSSSLQDKLSLLDSYVREAKTLLATPPPAPWESVGDLACERTVQRLVECAADCGDLWLAAKGKPEGVSATDVFRRLEEVGVIDGHLVKVLRDAVRMRNRIVHDYDTVSRAEMTKSAAALVKELPIFISKLGA